MKIYIVDQFIDGMGGVERIMNTLANNLDNYYNISVISIYRNKSNPFFPYKESININYLINDIPIFSENNFINHYINRLITKLKDKIFLKSKIVNLLDTISDEDVIIFGRVGVALLFLPYIKKKNKKTKIVVRDGLNLICYSKKDQKMMKKYFVELVDKFIVSSDESINEYKIFFDCSKMDIIKVYNPLGIIPKHKYNYESHKIVSLGRFVEQKGFDVLIRAFALVCSNLDNWKLELYGSGPMKKELIGLIEKLNMSNYISLNDSIKDVVSLYNRSSIFVCTSRYEGYANTLVEAGCCGLPLISFDWIVGVNEIIDNNKNGLIVHLKSRNDYYKGMNNIDDIYRMAESIKLLANNKKMCNKFSNYNKEFFDNRKTKKIISSWRKIIEELSNI